MSDPEGNRARVGRGMRQSGLSLTNLWVAYISLGGNLSPSTIGRYLEASGPLPELDVMQLAAALNDHFASLGLNHPVRLS